MSVRLKAIELADLLGVAQATVSGAAINDHLCGGYPVSEWADKNERGRILGYDVPDGVYHKLATGKVKSESGSSKSKASNQELRDKLFDKFYTIVVGLSLDEIGELEAEVRQRFGDDSMAFEEFKRAKKVDLNFREVEDIFASIDEESDDKATE